MKHRTRKIPKSFCWVDSRLVSVIREILSLTLCFDHRIADGAEAARFMNHLKRMLEDPIIFMTGI